jgi:hypothetical protein
MQATRGVLTSRAFSATTISTSPHFSTQWHQKHMKAAEAFLKDQVVARITSCISKLVPTFFPGIARRFQECVDWHDQRYRMQPLFGLYWCLCINTAFPGQMRIHCKPHVDSKNIVGVCTLVVYKIPGTKYNHSVRTWLVLWEARVVIQLLPWVVLLYPFSLIRHFNVDGGLVCSPHILYGLQWTFSAKIPPFWTGVQWTEWTEWTPLPKKDFFLLWSIFLGH